ncbi:unnamed protein product [Porites lobata]|uniref:CHAT domain-containing protein n=1 Tax=Porites lobata TaxID=104759 RepID=A0ABN8RGP4_9CNID|nr:unnamed protein product [Porites lobata]
MAEKRQEVAGSYENIKDFKNVVNYLEMYRKIAREEGGRANAYHGLGDFEKAIENHNRDLKMSKELGYRAGERKAYGNLGNAYYSLGDFQKAIEYHERHLKISKEMGDRAGEGRAYGNLGNAYHSLGELQKAIEYHERHLKICGETGDRAEKGRAYGNLGNVYYSLGDFQKAIKYHERALKILKDVGDRAGEGRAYGNLGNAYDSLGDFQKAIEYHERVLKISKEIGDRAGEGRAYGNLGNTCHSLGDFQKAIGYHERHLNISKQVGDRAGEGRAYGNFGNAYHSLGDFQKATEYHERALKISKQVGDRTGEGRAYGNLGNSFNSLGDLQKAKKYHERHLKISKGVGDRAGEGGVYGSLGNAYYSLGDVQKAIEYHERHLKISKQVGDRAGKGRAYCNLGKAYHSLGDFGKAFQHYKNGVRAFDDIRENLISNDELKISLGNTYNDINSRLWELQLTDGKVIGALLTADRGRAEALNDLLEFKYGLKGLRPEIRSLSAGSSDFSSYLPPNTVFIGMTEREIVLWVNEKGKEIKTRRSQIDIPVTIYFESLLKTTHEEIGVTDDVNCEDRSLRNPSDKKLSEQRSPSKPRSVSSCFETKSLQTFYNVVIDPIRDLLHGDEVVIVPQGPLCLAPYAAFMDLKSKYLCETFRIRLLPSLSSQRLIQNCPAHWHSKTGALLVGDPWVQEVVYEGRTLEQLEWAEKEVQMIGEILQTEPLVGKLATKDKVLTRISSVGLVHIAAHGKMETGEIALAPNTTRSPPIPDKEDYLLTMNDVLKAQIRARLVVLSCCHSAWGEVNAEGVVGIARAFLGAGARSVLVSLWAIEDEATMEFMKLFYQQLVNGRSASEALNKAMKSMRESDRFSAVKHWAPFVLIGEDVTLEFKGIK